MSRFSIFVEKTKRQTTVLITVMMSLLRQEKRRPCSKSNNEVWAFIYLFICLFSEMSNRVWPQIPVFSTKSAKYALRKARALCLPIYKYQIRNIFAIKCKASTLSFTLYNSHSVSVTFEEFQLGFFHHFLLSALSLSLWVSTEQTCMSVMCHSSSCLQFKTHLCRWSPCYLLHTHSR